MMRLCRHMFCFFAIFALGLSACGDGDSSNNASENEKQNASGGSFGSSDILHCSVTSESPLVTESTFGGVVTKTTIEYKDGTLFQIVESDEPSVLEEQCQDLKSDSDYGEVRCYEESVLGIGREKMSMDKFDSVKALFVMGCEMSDGKRITSLDELNALNAMLDSLEKSLTSSSSGGNTSLFNGSGLDAESFSCVVTPAANAVTMEMTAGGVTYKHVGVDDGSGIQIASEVSSPNQMSMTMICASVEGSYQDVVCSDEKVSYSRRLDGTTLATVEAGFRKTCAEWEENYGIGGSSSSVDNWNGNGSSSSSAIAYSFKEGLETFTDTRDGQVYTMVQIGDQLWMGQNLRYADSSETGTANLKRAAWCLDNVPENCNSLGVLYLWTAAMDKSAEECGHGKTCGITKFPHQGICPDNWHVPTQQEWEALRDYIGGESGNGAYKGNELMAKSESGSGTDKYGFGAVITGEYDFRQGYTHQFQSYSAAHFWTATEPDPNGAWNWYISGSDFTYHGFDKNMGYAVRCIHD